jgi:hypothetical protein
VDLENRLKGKAGNRYKHPGKGEKKPITWRCECGRIYIGDEVLFSHHERSRHIYARGLK